MCIITHDNIQKVFQILDFNFNFCLYIIEMSWGWDPSLNAKLIYVLYTSCTHSMKIIL